MVESAIMRSNKFLKSKWHENWAELLVISAILGGLIGIATAGYRLVIIELERLFQDLLATAVVGTAWAISVAIATYIGLALLNALLYTWEPLLGGGGVPHLFGEQRGTLRGRWWVIAPVKMGLVALNAGSAFGLGSLAGPLHAGGVLAGAVRFPRDETKPQQSLIPIGVAASLAAILHAPLAGLIFAIEAFEKRFSHITLLGSLCAGFIAKGITSAFFGLEPILSLPELPRPSGFSYGLILVLGLVCGLSGWLFYRLIILFRRVFSVLKMPTRVKILVTFLLILGALFLVPELFGSGNPLILKVAGDPGLPLPRVLLVYGLKMILITLAIAAGIAGGIFTPLMVTGALIGNALAQLAVQLGIIPAEQVLIFTVCAMAAHVAVAMHTPLTGLVLTAEMTGSFGGVLIPAGIAVAVAMIVARILAVRPINDYLYEQMPQLSGIDHSARSDEGEN